MLDINKILEYQTKDSDIIKLERKLNNSEDKKIYQSMKNIVKTAQNKSTALEKEANDMLIEYQKLEKKYNENLQSCGAVLNKKLDSISDADLDNIDEVAHNLVNNINILEKKLIYLAERVNAILSEFEQTKKKYNEAGKKYKAHKAAFEKAQAEIEPLIEAKKAEIKKLEKDIDTKLLTKYKQKRLDNVYPVFVPVKGTSCSCGMDIPSARMSELKKNGFLECEACHRVIYDV